MTASIGNLLNRLKMMAARGTVAGVNAALKMQGLQITLLANEAKNNVEHFEPYGFTAHPHKGAEILAVFLGGERGHGVVLVASDRRYRIQNLEAGEVAIYTDEDQQEGGHRIVFKRDQKIEIYAKEVKVVAADRVDVETQAATVQADSVDVTASTLTVSCPDIQFN